MNLADLFSIRPLLVMVLGLVLNQDRSYGEEYSTECSSEIVSCLEENQIPEQRISLRHTEGSGLGYAIGYTSLDLFLSKSFDNQDFLPFLDLRGHVFNNGRFAGNAGLGLRYLNPCFDQIWGANITYDYLEHLGHNPRRNYHQIGTGIEVIGDRWDVHLNAYMPVGTKKTNIYRFNYGFYEDLRREDLSRFRLGLKAREQVALNGIDALFGYRFCGFCNTDLHIGAGPYVYWGRTEKTTNAFTKKRVSAWGGRLTLDIIFQKYISLAGIVSYDSVFKWRGQGMVALNIPFDIFRCSCLEYTSCTPCTIRDRLYDNIRRNEIITVDSLTRFTNDPRVLDPEFQP